MAFSLFVETDQPTMEAFNEKFLSIIYESVSRGVKFISGSYKGTGTIDPVKIKAPGNPFFLLITGDSAIGSMADSWGVWFDGILLSHSGTSGSNNPSVSIENGDTIVITRKDGAQPTESYNKSGVSYNYGIFYSYDGGDA